MFTLHPVLAADTTEITRFRICHVLLMKDAHYPWLILVPALPDLTGLHELNGNERPQVMEEINKAASAMQQLYTPRRMNVAALGNVVEQLHIHVIARFESDPAWPKPVWGALPRKDYAPAQLQETVETLRRVLEQPAFNQTQIGCSNLLKTIK